MAGASSAPRYPLPALRTATEALFRHGGLDADKAQAVAASLLDADAMGHSTHGLALAPWYLEALASGAMARSGAVQVVSDRGACVAWSGQRLPGAWLIQRASDLALDRVAARGVVTVTIAGAHHTGAMATYLPRVTERGLVPLLCCSGPAATGVAPYGRTQPVFTPNPIAAGIPTAQDPSLLDISSSMTTNNRARQLAKAGQRFPAPWGLDRDGKATDNPLDVTQGGGSLLPVGGATRVTAWRCWSRL